MNCYPLASSDWMTNEVVVTGYCQPNKIWKMLNKNANGSKSRYSCSRSKSDSTRFNRSSRESVSCSDSRRSSEPPSWLLNETKSRSNYGRISQIWSTNRS